jgi:hypothetical protein
MPRRVLYLLLGLIIGLAPGLAAGGIDPKTDSFGIYFDSANYSTSINVGPFTPFNVYLVLMNPAAPVNGFECTVTATGAPFFALSTTLGGSGALDVDASANGFAVGASTNYPVVNGGLTVVTWSYMVQAVAPLNFYITKASIPSMTGNMPVVTGDGILRRCQVYTCDVTLPVATVNGGSPQPCDAPGGMPAIAVDINTNASGMQASQIRASTAALATNDYDGGIDLPRPAPPPSNYVATSFEHIDWSMGPRFSADVRDVFDPLNDYQIWPFMVETDRTGTVSLAFSPSFNSSANIMFYLRDKQTGQYFNLFPELSYTFTNNGLPNVYRYELIVGAAPILPSLDPTSRTIPAGWSMIALPLMPTSGSTVGSILTDQTPAYSYVFDYLPGSGYRNLGNTATVAQGTGYWMATESSFEWTMNGTRDIDGATIGLSPGWNLVGNINWFPGPFEGIRVVRGGTSYDWLTAVQNGWVSAAIQTFDPVTGSYSSPTNLQPWNSYWVNALTSDISLYFYWGNFVQLPKRLATGKSLLDPDDNDWRADLTLLDAADQRRIITIGARGDASAGFDALFDTPLPPQPPAGGPSLSVWRPEWDLAGGAAFSTDLVNLQDEATSWPIVVTTPNQGRAVLTWDPKQWPEGADFQLYVPAENRVAVRSMRSQTNYVFKMGAQAVQLVVRTPNFTSGVDPSTPTTWHMSVQPNPFNPQTTISFDLPTAGRAEVRIFSVRGELVTVLGGETRVAGSYREVWNGADRQGRDAPSGSYFARLYVDGQVRGEVTKMSLLR